MDWLLKLLKWKQIIKFPIKVKRKIIADVNKKKIELQMINIALYFIRICFSILLCKLDTLIM